MPEHKSDCAIHNEPAMPAGSCDCGAMSASFTPGPWENDRRTIKASRGVIARCPLPQDGGTFDVQTNARLIAAAPDLLAALNGLLEIEETRIATGAFTPNAGAQSRIEAARAAIAKATA